MMHIPVPVSDVWSATFAASFALLRRDGIGDAENFASSVLAANTASSMVDARQAQWDLAYAWTCPRCGGAEDFRTRHVRGGECHATARLE